MKKRRNVLFAFVIVALLAIGFGYAALTDSLVINGTATGSGAGDPTEPGSGNETDEDLFDIQWVAGTANATATPAAGSTSVVSATATIDNVNEPATLTVKNMAVKGDKVVATYQFKLVECPAGYDAKLEVKLNEPKAKDMVDATAVLDAYTVALDGTVTVTVTVELNQTLISDTDSLDYALTVEIVAEPVAK